MTASTGSTIRELRKDREYALAELMIEIGTEKRIEVLKKAFSIAIKNFDDEKAEFLLKWIFSSISDLYPNNNNEVLSLKAATAIELYKNLPLTGVGKAHELYSQNESRLVSADVPVFKKTRMALITEIALSWKTTKDEAEADKLLCELLSLPSKFEEEIKERLQIVRKVTDASFGLKRLLRHAHKVSVRYKKMVTSTSSKKFEEMLLRETCQILTIAWVRNKVDSRDANFDFVGIDKQLEILSKVEEFSMEALTLLLKELDQIIPFDLRVKDLKQKINKEEDLIRKFHPDKLDIELVNPRYIKLHLDHSNYLAESAWSATTNFDLLCNVVRRWKKIDVNSKTKAYISYSYKSYVDKKVGFKTEILKVTL